MNDWQEKQHLIRYYIEANKEAPTHVWRDSNSKYLSAIPASNSGAATERNSRTHLNAVRQSREHNGERLDSSEGRKPVEGVALNAVIKPLVLNPSQSLTFDPRPYVISAKRQQMSINRLD